MACTIDAVDEVFGVAGLGPIDDRVRASEARVQRSWLRSRNSWDLDAVGWCDLVQKFGKLFKRAADAAESLSMEAAKASYRSPRKHAKAWTPATYIDFVTTSPWRSRSVAR
jgi:hypothetical protein